MADDNTTAATEERTREVHEHRHQGGGRDPQVRRRRARRLDGRQRRRASPGPLQVRQFRGGQSNPTYQLITPTKKYVMRRKPPGKLLPSAHAVDREYRVITALYPTGFPVPRTYGLCTDDGVIGTLFYVMDTWSRAASCGTRRLPSYAPSRAARRSTWRAEDARRPAQHRLPGDRPWRLRARRATTCSARSTAGPSSTRPRETQHIETVERLIEWLPETCPEDDTDLDRPRRLPPGQRWSCTPPSRA